MILEPLYQLFADSMSEDGQTLTNYLIMNFDLRLDE